MDMEWSDDPEESFTVFQGRILEEYDRMVDEFGLTVIDATKSIEKQQKIVRSIVTRHLNADVGAP
jgi:dTMP kinase